MKLIIHILNITYITISYNSVILIIPILLKEKQLKENFQPIFILCFRQTFKNWSNIFLKKKL